MQLNCSIRQLLVCLLVVSACVPLSQARGRGGGRSSSRSSSSSSSRSSPSYSRPSPSYSRPSPSYSMPPAPNFRISTSYLNPAPAPAPAPKPRPAPSYRPSPRPAQHYRPSPRPAQPYRPTPRPAQSHRPSPPTPKSKPSFYNPSPKPAAIKPTSGPQPPVASRPSESVVVRQPAYNPSFKESDARQSSSSGGKQPAYNPNYRPDVGNPAGPPPPYSPSGQAVPNAPVGPPPTYGATHGNPPPGVPLPPYYPGPAVRPPPGYPGSYQNQPGVNPSYPVQPGHPGSYQNQPGVKPPYPVQPGSHANKPGVNHPYPVQPGHPGSYQNQPGVNRPYPVQPNYPGNFQQPNANRPYPVQPGHYNPYPGVNRPYPPQSLGGNVWQPQYGAPAPAYMNYGGIPTGTNIYTKPHKKKGFLGSLMSVSKGKDKSKKKNKYYGSYPSPYGVGQMGSGPLGHMGSGPLGHMGSGSLGHMGNGFLGKHSSSPVMNTIFPYMVAKKLPKLKKPKFGFGHMPMYVPTTHYYHHHRHHYHHRHSSFDMDSDIDSQGYFDVYNEDYVGKCLHPIKKNHTEIKCKTTFEEIQCDAKCEDGYKFPYGVTLVSNKCWHAAGVWQPKKNFPDCKPVCDAECRNGGECIRPGVCKCPPDFRGDRCQFRKSNFMKCDIRQLTKGEKLGWVCHHLKDETKCKIRCVEPAEFESPPAEEYVCSPEGGWKPDTVPHCVESKKAKRDLENVLQKLY